MVWMTNLEKYLKNSVSRILLALRYKAKYFDFDFLFVLNKIADASLLFSKEEKKDESAENTTANKKADSDSEEEEQDDQQKEKGLSNKKKKV